MKLKIAAISDKGCIRSGNEDMILIGDSLIRDADKECIVDINNEVSIYFAAVADGMGGHNAGEIASEIVLTKMADKIKTLDTNLDVSVLDRAILDWAKEIHTYILDEGIKDPNKKGMGSTLAGALFYAGNVFCINVGDSRFYRFRRGNLMQISKDHSLRQLTGDDTVNSNIIVNSFGGGTNIDVDFEPAGGKILENDLFLICSDGLSDELTDDEIEHILEQGKSVDILLKNAKEKGGRDNISIITICISDVS